MRMAQQVHDGMLALGAVSRSASGSTHPDVLAALGSLYADTVSHLRPRVLVQGNPHYLGQAGVVAEIRAVLLAALRSAVLWRQLGGSLWDFLLRRREHGAGDRHAAGLSVAPALATAAHLRKQRAFPA